jgi:hypothetical protein
MGMALDLLINSTTVQAVHSKQKPEEKQAVSDLTGLRNDSLRNDG